MKPIDAYKHCLLCGESLTPENDYLKCTQCGYKHHLNPAPTNGVIIENEHGEILLVERRIEPKKGYWDLPGGFISVHENLEESVRREIQEELGVEIEMKQIVGTYADDYEYQNVLVPTFGIIIAAKITKGQITVADDVSSYQFFPKEEVLQQKIAFESVEKGLRAYLGVRD